METEYVKKQRLKGKEKLYNIFKDREDYKILSKYTSNKAKIKIQHLKGFFLTEKRLSLT